MHAGEIIIPVVFFALVFGIVYIAIAARNKERMALIEKGADVSIFHSERKPGTGKWILTLGIFIIGAAIGVLVGYLLETAGMDAAVAFVSSIFIFGGVGLVLAYFIGRKVNGNKE